MGGRIECAKILLKKGADPAVKDKRGRTPVDCVKKPNKPLVDLLTPRPAKP